MENTCFCDGIVTDFEDHLHIRGEYQLKNLNFLIMKGSPPHTWRIHFKMIFEKKPIRITSTYVENTAGIRSLFKMTKDHLHIRGEYIQKLPVFVVI